MVSEQNSSVDHLVVLIRVAFRIFEGGIFLVESSDLGTVSHEDEGHRSSDQDQGDNESDNRKGNGRSLVVPAVEVCEAGVRQENVAASSGQ